MQFEFHWDGITLLALSRITRLTKEPFWTLQLGLISEHVDVEFEGSVDKTMVLKCVSSRFRSKNRKDLRPLLENRR